MHKEGDLSGLFWTAGTPPTEPPAAKSAKKFIAFDMVVPFERMEENEGQKGGAMG